MRTTSLFAVILLAVPAGFALPQASRAADATAVIKACDRTPSCGYTQNDNGDISGCSSHACFYCPADGKHQCIGVGASIQAPPKDKVHPFPGQVRAQNLTSVSMGNPRPGPVHGTMPRMEMHAQRRF